MNREDPKFPAFITGVSGREGRSGGHILFRAVGVLHASWWTCVQKSLGAGSTLFAVGTSQNQLAASI
ncbi:MAG: hypothetical protein ABI041_05575 [Bdellovibrionia bacterium]